MEALLDANRIVVEHNCSLCNKVLVEPEDSKKTIGNANLVKLPQCVHCFHRRCIKKWFESCKYQESDLSCPVCRKTISSKPNLKKRSRVPASLDEAIAVYKRMCHADRDQMTYYTAGKFADTISATTGSVSEYSDSSSESDEDDPGSGWGSS